MALPIEGADVAHKQVGLAFPTMDAGVWWQETRPEEGGQPDPSWRGRNDGRNAAFGDLLFSSGLRLREGGCLLTLEVPDAVAGHCYYEGSVAGAVAKRRERMFYASAAALRRVAGYVATTRRLRARRRRSSPSCSQLWR